MSYQVLYRTYRPTTFDEVVGQEYIVKTLKNAIKTNRIAHAYLFCGPRGTGKTSIAKLFSKAVNCTGEETICGECENCKAFINNSHPDVIELDAASNNSVENIREIVDKVKYAPILGKYKVYIIDEVHMLSGAAFNALLKTLEEPPANVIFILATTEPNKVIPTVMSRCQRYNFSKVEPFNMRKRIEYILKKENIAYDDHAIDLIISLSDGGMRDVLSILEQVLAYGNYELRVKDVVEIFGLVSVDEKIKLISYVKHNDVSSAIKETRSLYQQGMDIRRLTQDLIQILKETYLYSNGGEALIKTINKIEAETILNLYNNRSIVSDINILLNTLDNYKNTYDVLSYFEITLFKLAASKGEGTSEYRTKPKEELQPETGKVDKTKVIRQEERIDEPVETSNDINEKVSVETAETQKDHFESKKFETMNSEPIVVCSEEEEVQMDENPIQEDRDIPMSKEFLLSILVRATRPLKMADMVIYSKLNSFTFDPEKKRYACMIKGSEIFASSDDAIVFKHVLDAKKHQINEKVNNQGLYWFLKDEFGIDKMPFCIDDKDQAELIAMFKNKNDYDLNNYKINKYQKNVNNKTTEDVLYEMFGDKVRVED